MKMEYDKFLDLTEDRKLTQQDYESVVRHPNEAEERRRGKLFPLDERVRSFQPSDGNVLSKKWKDGKSFEVSFSQLYLCKI